jgi:tetratricopeptide (TPR) repeat protein
MQKILNSLPAVPKQIQIVFMWAIIAIVTNKLQSETEIRYLTIDNWGKSFIGSSAIINPALPNEIQYKSLRLSTIVGKDNPYNAYHFAAMVPIDLYRTVSVNMIMLQGKEIKNWKYENNLLVEDKISRSRSGMLSVSYCSNMWKKLTFGTNANVLYLNNFNYRIVGIALDAGLTYRLLMHPLFGYHLVGLSLKNIATGGITSNTDRQGLFELNMQYHTELYSNRIIFDGRFGVTDVTIGTNAKSKNLQPAAFTGAIQAGFNILSIFTVRIFNEFNSFNTWGTTGFSCGINLKSVNQGRDASVNYEYIRPPDNIVSSTRVMSANFDLGESREMLYARKISRKISIDELFMKAKRYYESNEFMDALFLFQQIKVNYPNFEIMDDVVYYIASCFAHEEMFDEAEKNYLQVLSKYKNNKKSRLINLELLKINYYKNNFENTKEYLNTILEENNDDSIAQCANYYIGEALIKNSYFEDAVFYLEKINEKHPFFIFAQYSKAISLANNGASDSLIKSVFENCLSAVCQDDVSREIMNKTLVMLGYIYYEQDILDKAIAALDQVDEKSYYFTDALLGKIWTFIKIKDWKKAEQAGNELLSTTDASLIRCEALLLQVYIKIRKGEYRKANDLMRNTTEKMVELTRKNTDDQVMTLFEIEELKKEYKQLSKMVAEISIKDNVIDSRLFEGVKNKQVGLKQLINRKIENFNKKMHESTIDKSSEEILDDIDFIAAKLTLLLNTTLVDDKPESSKELKAQIAEEISQLKQELEYLNNANR